MEGDADVYLRAAQAAGYLKVSAKTLSRWAKEGRVPHVHTLGGHRRFRLSQILQLAHELGLRD